MDCCLQAHIESKVVYETSGKRDGFKSDRPLAIERRKAWLKRKRASRKVFGKHAAADTNIAVCAVHIAGKGTGRQPAKISDIFFMKSLCFFNTGFLY
jgi:hypothetical protein